jgi:NAD+ synthase (glutamine-hydrolysing)
MKIALAQINPHIGNFEENSDKILNIIEHAKQLGVNLVVFPELSVCGYPPQDFLEHEDFVEQAIQTVEKIAKSCTSIAAIVGAPSLNPDSQGKKLYNSAWFLAGGIVKNIVHKTHLPNYDVFDEYRYFEHNQEFKCVEYDGKRFVITICEDLWDEQPVADDFAQSKLYKVSPILEYSSQKPDFIINISASPFSFNQEFFRRDVMVSNSIRFSIPIIYVNQVGANTELIFDGGSMVLNSAGRIVQQLPFFKEDFQIIDTNDFETLSEQKPNLVSSTEKIYHALILGIQDYFRKSNFSKATLGLSGGIDSALTLVLAERALGPANVRVLLLPSVYSSEHSVADSIQLAENIGIQYDIIPIQSIVEQTNQQLQPIFNDSDLGVTEENIQARIRGVLLMAFSNKLGHILLNTSNKSEAAVGYGTLYGDMNGGLSVLGDVYKTEIYRLCKFINREKEIIPENILLKPPSAELRPDQKDSDSLPDYSILDSILFQYIEQKKCETEIIASGYDSETVKKVIRLVNMNEYKRFQAPPILRISSKAFGFGRRMPIVAKY